MAVASAKAARAAASLWPGAQVTEFDSPPPTAVRAIGDSGVAEVAVSPETGAAGSLRDPGSVARVGGVSWAGGCGVAASDASVVRQVEEWPSAGLCSAGGR